MGANAGATPGHPGGESAASRLGGESAVSRLGGESAATHFGSGRHVARLEDEALLRGQGQFTDDAQAPLGPPALVLHFVRSTVARGRIRGIDLEAARALPGIVAIYTGQSLHEAGVHGLPPAHSFARADGQPIAPPQRQPLALGTVGFVGEALVAIVAEDLLSAKAAAEAVVCDIEPLPAVSTAAQALSEAAPQLWPGAPGNIVAELRHGDSLATAQAFAGAAHVVQLLLQNQRLAPTPIEPRCALAWVEGGRLIYRCSNQMPTAVRNELAHCLPGLEPKDIRVLVGDVGGGFGMKTGPYAEDIVLAHAAWQLQRPVRWTAERVEEFLSALHGRDLLTQAEMALAADGRVLALRLRSYGNVGAYPTFPGVLITLALGPWVTTGVYDIPLIDFHLSAVLTNTAPVGPYRGAGRPEAVYICERLMDAAATKLGLPREQLRRRNLIRPEQMPYPNPMAQTYDCGQFERMLDQGLALADWAGFEARRAASLAKGKLRGRGIATFLEWTGGPTLEEGAQVRVAGDGFIEIRTALMAMGQGLATSYAQLAVDVFGVPIERVRILQGDTDLANGFGSAASRSLFTGGAAVQAASRRSVDLARELAGEALEAPAADIEYTAGRFSIAGTDRGIGLFELAARQAGGQFFAEAKTRASGPSWPNACHIVELEVDAATGATQVVSYASVNDIGRVINPAIVRGQVEGGAVQGIGQALCEGIAYDASGQLLSASFMDYSLPRADDCATGFLTVFDETTPCLTNVLGAKGVGELGTIGATPAVVNAVIDALASAGFAEAAQRLQMPLTAPKLWAVLQGELPKAPPWPHAAAR
jgi:aerobic carbon-monoxide dehydrogenase large subunit